jgi:hypothetical protein
MLIVDNRRKAAALSSLQKSSAAPPVTQLTCSKLFSISRARSGFTKATRATAETSTYQRELQKNWST